MPLTDDQIESASPDAWTGKPAAIVYQTAAQAATYLVSIGLSTFNAADLADQEAALARATDTSEDSLRRKLRGQPVERSQGLLLPAFGAYDYNGRLMPTSGDLEVEVPAIRALLRGIALLAEHITAGTFMPSAQPGAGGGVTREWTRRGGVEFQDGADTASVAANHPEVHRKIRQIVPRMR